MSALEFSATRTSCWALSAELLSCDHAQVRSPAPPPHRPPRPVGALPRRPVVPRPRPRHRHCRLLTPRPRHARRRLPDRHHGLDRRLPRARRVRHPVRDLHHLPDPVRDRHRALHPRRVARDHLRGSTRRPIPEATDATLHRRTQGPRDRVWLRPGRPGDRGRDAPGGTRCRHHRPRRMGPRRLPGGRVHRVRRGHGGRGARSGRPRSGLHARRRPRQRRRQPLRRPVRSEPEREALHRLPGEQRRGGRQAGTGGCGPRGQSPRDRGVAHGGDGAPAGRDRLPRRRHARRHARGPDGRDRDQRTVALRGRHRRRDPHAEPTRAPRWSRCDEPAPSSPTRRRIWRSRWATSLIALGTDDHLRDLAAEAE